jgi:sugar phosphate isomerase/epimerase
MERNADEVREIVERHLALAYVEDPEGKITLHIDPTYIVREPYAWHVGIRPSRDADRQWRFYEELAVIAENIAVQDGLEVHLIPGEPLKAKTSAEAAVAA